MSRFITILICLVPIVLVLPLVPVWDQLPNWAQPAPKWVPTLVVLLCAPLLLVASKKG